MHVLFIHRAFPAQFGRLALELTRRYGWKCSFVLEHLSRCPEPSPEMLEAISLHVLPRPQTTESATHWAQRYGKVLEQAALLADFVRQQPALRPDLVVGHGGLLPTLLLREVLDCPIIDYCEYWFATSHRDITYRQDLPPVEMAPFSPRCINAATLVNLLACDSGYSPTAWQRASFPRRFADKIEVHFDGIDMNLYAPRTVPRKVAGRHLPADRRVVTFIARGLESLRGFDLFVHLAQRISATRDDVLFVVAGGEESCYGWDQLFTGGLSFKQWVLRQSSCDLSPFLFLGHLAQEELASLLCLSDLHVYLSAPFVLSWSLVNALACECVVLAGDTPPVREVLRHEQTGLIEPLFDVDSLATTALRVLENPQRYRPLGQAARHMVEEHYSLDVCVPALKDYFERVAGGVQADSTPIRASASAPHPLIRPSRARSAAE
jgi:glycosyltransferase involved in cell wall biosynthesis